MINLQVSAQHKSTCLWWLLCLNTLDRNLLEQAKVYVSTRITMTNSILMGSRIAPCSFRSLGFHLLSVQFYYFYCTTLTSRLMEQTLLFHGWNFCIKEYLMLLKNLLKTTKHINMTHIELLTGTNISFSENRECEFLG